MNLARATAAVGIAWASLAAAVAQPPAVETVAPPVATGDRAPLGTRAEELGYALGFRIGQRIIADHRALGTPLDPVALARGLADAVRDAPPQLDEAGFRRVLSAFEKQMEEKDRELAARMAGAAKKNLAAGQEFLAGNAKQPGVATLPSGLQYTVLKEGAGPKPTLDDVVEAHYRGTHVDGTEFDGTEPGGEPAAFPLRGVVPGWQEALPLMKAGSKWRVWLPAELGYGDAGSPPAIEPNEVLVFEIELVAIRPRGE